MPLRTAKAHWQGTLLEGKGTMKTGSGGCESAYWAGSRFADERGSTPDEMLGAALAGCYSMALAGMLDDAGYEPRAITTAADISIEKQLLGWTITGIRLKVEADVPGIDDGTLMQIAQAAKSCPVSRALAATSVSVESKLLTPSSR